MPFRYAIRTLLKNPGFAAVAILTLALGIGANTAIFSVVNGALLRPLPFEDPGQLAILWETRPGRDQVSLSPGEFEAWDQQNHAFSGMAALDYEVVNVTGRGEPVQSPAGFVSTNFFNLLGTRAALGRLLQPSDSQPGHEPVVVISHGLWEQQYGSDPSMVGRTIDLDDSAYSIVGVLPRGFTFWNYPAVEVWAPAIFPTTVEALHADHHLNAVGRLKPGETVGAAGDDLNTVMAQLGRDYPDYYKGYGASVVSLHATYFSGIQAALLVLMGAVGFVLLIACANVANLLLARAAGRQHEVAVRAALGATRAHLVRLFLTECLVVSTAGGLLGLFFAVWGEDALVRLTRDVLPSVAVVSLDAPVFIFTAAVSILTGVVFGIGPALQASRPDVNDALKDGGRGSASPSRHRLRSALVVAEVALSVMLLVGAGLLLRSFDRLLNTNPGFNPAHVLAAEVTLPERRYADSQQQRAFFDALVDRTRALPGVTRAGLISALPLSGTGYSSSFTIEGQPEPPAGHHASVNNRIVTPDYFQAMGIPLMKGRAFAGTDDASALPVAVINTAMAHHYWPTADPLGQRIRLGEKGAFMTIVGIVGDVRFDAVDQSGADEVYAPFEQSPKGDMTLVLRATGDPLALAGALKAQVAALDRNLPLGNMTTMDNLVSQSAAPRRLNAVLIGSFAGLALLLAAIGVYGVMSYTIAQRTHEIGVRISLGASSGDILRHVLEDGMRLVGVGLAAGLVGAAILSHSLASLLFEVRPLDGVTFAAVPVVLAAIALAACYIPARRAGQVDPIAALRGES
jgi:putative ABC transport system permease protein